MDLVRLAEAIGGFSAAASLAVAAWALNRSSDAAATQARAQQLTNIPMMYRDYLDRRLPVVLGTPNGPLDEIAQIRLIPRHYLLRVVKDPLDCEDWRAFLEASCKREAAGSPGYEWQNRFAHETSIALQRIGLLTLSGALPVEVVLADIALRVIEDWAFCLPLVAQVRGDATIGDQVYWQRRHAEWLAAMSALYLLRYDPSPSVLGAIQHAFPTLSHGEDVLVQQLRAKELKLRSADTGMITAATMSSIRALTRDRHTARR